MGLSSMTGFARSEGRTDDVTWSWEARSVNGKGLDVRLRLPAGFERVEVPARQQVAAAFKRGNISLNLTVQRVQGGAPWHINHGTLDNVLAFLPELRRRLPGAAEPSLDGILGIRGVVEPLDDQGMAPLDDQLQAAILATLDTVLESLSAMRGDEGARLTVSIAAHLDTISDLCAEASALAETQPEALRTRLRDQVQALLDSGTPLPEERLAQETALLAAKADIREELDRLTAHVSAAREMVSGGEPVGRKLDFLCQEFNREANTLCSKSSDVALTRLGLDLKAAIEQLREQVQNIE